MLASLTMQLHTAHAVLPINGEPISDGGLVTEAGSIVAVGTREELERQYPQAEKIEHKGAVILPGLVNAHAHLDLFGGDLAWSEQHFIQSLLGLVDYKNGLSQEDRRESILNGLRKSLESGTTCLADVGSYQDLARVVDGVGIRLTVFSEILLSGDKSIEESFNKSLNFVEEARSAAGNRVRVGIAPYAPYMLSRHLLKVLAQHCREMKIPVQIHAAESFAEMQFFYDSGGEVVDVLFKKAGWEGRPPAHRKTPVEFLDSIGFLEASPMLVGCLHLSEADLRKIRERHVAVVHCPRSNTRLRLGKAPVQKILAAGIPVALGTDLSFQNDSVSLWDEMRAALELHGGGANAPVSASEILEMATLGGASALGMESEIGSLEKGKKADFIVVASHENIPLEELAGWLIRHTREGAVKKVYVDGIPLKGGV
ncbi:MAG: amidohydrolase family protein [bacterium]|nr:amidohydrolase family protein [bacterium]